MKQITGAGSLDELAGLLAVLAGTAGQKFGGAQTGSFFVSVCPCCVQEVVGLPSSEVSRDSRTCRAAARARRARLHVLYFTKYLLDKLHGSEPVPVRCVPCVCPGSPGVFLPSVPVPEPPHLMPNTIPP